VIRKILTVVLVAGLAGCVSSQNQNMTTQLQMRVGEIEKQAEMKDEEIKNLQNEVRELSYNVDRLNSQVRKEYGVRGVSTSSKTSAKGGDEVLRVNVSGEKVQSALQAAGYYKGTVDGKLGAKTRDAISQFQKDHGLKADGVIGERTWTELKSYLK
jgi:peptidoglycan hydrolase-like protein with peptidoglycan-binding domain